MDGLVQCYEDELGVVRILSRTLGCVQVESSLMPNSTALYVTTVTLSLINFKTELCTR